MVIRFMRIAIPFLLLVASLSVYLGFVRPKASENKERCAFLDENSQNLLDYLRDKDLAPTAATLHSLISYEEELNSEFEIPKGTDYVIVALNARREGTNALIPDLGGLYADQLHLGLVVNDQESIRL